MEQRAELSDVYLRSLFDRTEELDGRLEVIFLMGPITYVSRPQEKTRRAWKLQSQPRRHVAAQQFPSRMYRLTIAAVLWPVVRAISRSSAP